MVRPSAASLKRSSSSGGEPVVAIDSSISANKRRLRTVVTGPAAHSSKACGASLLRPLAWMPALAHEVASAVVVSMHARSSCAFAATERRANGCALALSAASISSRRALGVADALCAEALISGETEGADMAATLA